MNAKQMGTIIVSEDIIRCCPEKVAEVFAMIKFVPVRAELMFMCRGIQYTGISERFEENEEGCMPKEYTIEIEVNDKGWPILVTVIHDVMNVYASWSIFDGLDETPSDSITESAKGKR